MVNGTFHYQKIHAKQILRENSIQAVLNATTEFNLYLKLSESSVQIVFIREHCQRYHCKHDLLFSENSFQYYMILSENPVQTAFKVNGV